jgi:hypothetical protein
MKTGDLVRPTQPSDEIPSNVYRVSEVYEDRDMVYFSSIDGVFTHYLAPHQLERLEPLFESTALQQVDAIADFAKERNTETAYISRDLEMFRLKASRAIYRLVPSGTTYHVILWRAHS